MPDDRRVIFLEPQGKTTTTKEAVRAAYLKEQATTAHRKDTSPRALRLDPPAPRIGPQTDNGPCLGCEVAQLVLGEGKQREIVCPECRWLWYGLPRLPPMPSDMLRDRAGALMNRIVTIDEEPTGRLRHYLTTVETVLFAIPV